ncbi:hypothetical protein GCM10020221_08630 [Streptomyces thioluteus]|uniref:Uncharacterized protein n=1 Tax=Streptomyces thioluteus TaxID=66431 RepID=A0ABP6IZQ6_STRTU
MIAGLVAQYSYLAGFLGEAALTLVCAVLCFLKLPESRPEPAARAEEADGPAVGLGSVLRDGRFMAVTGLSLLLTLLFHQSSVALPGVDGPGRALQRRLRDGDGRQRRPDRRPPDPGHPPHRTPRPRGCC